LFEGYSRFAEEDLMKTATMFSAALLVLGFVLLGWAMSSSTAPEAPSGFDNQTIDPNFVAQSVHAVDQTHFDTVEQAEKDGLGPIYNAQSCRECHQNPTSGAVSQVTELRVGHLGPAGVFENPSIPIDHGQEVIIGRTLINDRAICPEIQEHVPDTETIRTRRLAVNTLGDGFIEAVADDTLLSIAKDQCRSTRGKICGQALRVPVVEAVGQTAVGRFGWKDQHASLLSFAGDAYLNEMGITNRLFPTEVTSICNPKSVTEPNDQPDPTDHLEDIDHFARFMRASKAPPRDETLAATDAAQRGSKLFARIGCNTCHLTTLTTAKAGTKVNGGQFTIPDALGEKAFHPYSDFLLHDVGTADGIAIAVVEHYAVPAASVQALYKSKQSAQVSFDEVDKVMNRRGFSYKAVHDGRNKIRTAPLWGLRTHSRLMHDGDSVRLRDAIDRHKGEASEVTQKFHRLTPAEQKDLLSFLNSL
jgi:CxxC motif-containing protein (DUF1111 family)